MSKMNLKILSKTELASSIQRVRDAKKTIAHCHGVFDLVHPGHIRHLKVAAQQADFLIVSITEDKFVNKGPGRPVYNSLLRAETLASLEFVDFVFINNFSTAVKIIQVIKPDVYIKGSDYAVADDDVTGMIKEEAAAVKSAGGRVFFTDEIVMSSSELLNAYFDVIRPETQIWLTNLTSQHDLRSIVDCLLRVRKLKVAVVGEAIIDEYCFCEGLGKSSKDPILAFKHGSTEVYAGGSLSVANHLAGICDDVTLITMFGNSDDYDKFIYDHLNEKIKIKSVRQLGIPTIQKKRYVDTHTGNKLFEIYTLDDAPLEPKTEKDILELIETTMGEVDLVIVSDYGHGMITDKVVKKLEQTAPYLAVNTQANAGNRGFNTISKYSKADYVCLNGGEVRLETRKKDEDYKILIKEIATNIECNKFTITLGRDGTLHYEAEDMFLEAPALASNIADRVGAGDAVFSLTAPMVAMGVPWDIVGFFGNLAGAEVVAEIGTSRILESSNLIKFTQTMLK
jgi:rfaE bifunctional protein kinase chain/domain/rfaE bifunctional protein nucleotidyltransferase chain/domain